MNTFGKILIGAGAILGAFGIYKLATKSENGEGGSKGNLNIVILDQSGNPITGLTNGHLNIGAVASGLVAGGSGYQAVVTLNNTSVYQGTTTPAPYTFAIQCSIVVGGVTILSNTQNVAMDAGETGKTVQWTFSIPITASGSASATATLLDQAGNVLNTAKASFSVSAPVVTPGGSLTF